MWVVLADNQSDICENLARIGACLNLGRFEQLDSHTIAARLKDLFHDPENLRSLSQNAAAVCDGTGVDKIAHELVFKQTY